MMDLFAQAWDYFVTSPWSAVCADICLVGLIIWGFAMWAHSGTDN